MGNLILNLVLQILGVLFILGWLAGRLGVWKNWYWSSQHLIYGFIPYGIALILISFDAQIRLLLPPNDGWIPIPVYVLVVVIGITATIWPPQWLKPAWIRTIEAYPRFVYHTMSRQVTAGAKWRDKVDHPRTLEAWIREIQHQRSPKKK